MLDTGGDLILATRERGTTDPHRGTNAAEL